MEREVKTLTVYMPNGEVYAYATDGKVAREIDGTRVDLIHIYDTDSCAVTINASGIAMRRHTRFEGLPYVYEVRVVA